MSYDTGVTVTTPGLHVSFRTACGREIRVGHLVLGGGHRPAHRVSLDIGASSDSETGIWAGLTEEERRGMNARTAATLRRSA